MHSALLWKRKKFMLFSAECRLICCLHFFSRYNIVDYWSLLFTKKCSHGCNFPCEQKSQKKSRFRFFSISSKKMEIFDLEFGNRPSLKLHHINLTAVVMTAKDDTNSEVLCWHDDILISVRVSEFANDDEWHVSFNLLILLFTLSLELKIHKFITDMSVMLC